MKSKTLLLWNLLLVSSLPAQTLTHGPVVGGVTATEARVFVRSSQSVNVTIQYSTDPGLAGALSTSPVLTTDDSDFTATIPLIGLTAETTYYLSPGQHSPSIHHSAVPLLCHFSATGFAEEF